MRYTSPVAHQVLIDFTHPDVSPRLVAAAVGAGLHVVVGTSGYDEIRTQDVGRLVDGNPGVGVVVRCAALRLLLC